ncbi:MAG: HD domain-containing protein [Bacilli bacterium]|nr:HD domain-containing protein [Bacilli bacterium]
MSEKRIDSSFLDKAIIYATKAHQNVERREKGFPYIVHPLEAMSIVATLTNDQEVLAAAVLHDVVEDTDITLDELRKEFGDRVANLVALESDNMDPGYRKGLTWKEKKILGLKRIKNSDRDAQIVALGDKLSNMRAIHLDWLKYHEKIFERFHESDPSIHAWRYYQLSNCFDKLVGTPALEEFKYLVRDVFGEYLHDFKIEKNEKILKIYGKIDANSALFIADEINKINDDAYLDFSDVAGVDNEAVRTFYNLAINGKRYFIRNANMNIMNLFYKLGVATYVPITEKPREITLDDYEESGDGYTAISYNHVDGDLMMKLYAPFIAPEEVEKEKIVATRVLSLGINTPLCGDLVTYKGQYGITFERIKNKRSVARAISQEPNRIEEFVHLYTQAVKKLHATKCDTTLFDPVSKSFLNELERAKEHFSDEEYLKVKEFITSHEGPTTCIHGDLHIGNVLLTPEGNTLFIDMADFSYGDPLYDVSVLYVMSHLLGEEQCQRLYHVSKAEMQNVWELFVKEYYNVSRETEIKAIEETIKPYAGVRIIQFANRSKWRDGAMANNVKKLIFGYQEGK